MKRGEIYYIARRDAIGAETMKARPGVIVSNDALNATSEVVEVVYLTTQPKKEAPTHVIIEATGCTSTAICEHIDHVSTLLIGDYCGTCSAEEMRAINAALVQSLGIEVERETPVQLQLEGEAFIKTCAERDIYKSLVDQMLRQGVCSV